MRKVSLVKATKLNKGKPHPSKGPIYQWINRAHAIGAFKALDRFLRQACDSIDLASATPISKRIWVERDRPVSPFDFTFTIADHVSRGHSNHRYRVWIAIVEAQSQAKKPHSFLPLELGIESIAIEDVLHVTVACQSRN